MSWSLFLATALLAAPATGPATQPADTLPAPTFRLTFDALPSAERSTITESSITLVDGRVGKAARFDGEASVVVVPAAQVPISGKGFTISVWARPESPPTTYGSILASNGNKGLLLRVNNGGRIGINADKSWHAVVTEDVRKRTEWLHVAVTRDEKVIRLYLQGERIGEHTLSGAAAEYDVHFLIGARDDGPPAQNLSGTARREFYRGLLDDLRVYDVPLDDTQVKQLATQP